MFHSIIHPVFQLSSQYLPVQMPDFYNVSLPVDNKEDGIIAIEVDDLGVQEVNHDYQVCFLPKLL